MDIAADNPFIAAAVAAERLLRCRDVHPFRKLVSIPSAPNTTLAEAIGMEKIGTYEDEEDGLLRIYSITKDKWASK